MASTTSWDSWHLHVPAFGAAAGDQVVARVVGPAADRLRAWESPTVWFFVRYWQFGPHVRFRVLGLDQEQSDQLDALLRRQLTDTLAGITTALSPEEYQRIAAPLAAAGEGGQALELGDLWPPGVYRRPYLPEIDRYGGAARLAQSEALFATSSELALAFLRRNPPGAARSGLGLCATRAALDALADGDRRRRFCRRAGDGWQAWASRGGGGLPQVPQVPARLRAVEGVEGRTPAPVRRWAEQLCEAMTTWQAEAGEDVAERILHSHVHMLHNRLGLSVGEERSNYLVLAEAVNP
jgi:Lantibiotic biosynthesis dehydratase C-term